MPRALNGAVALSILLACGSPAMAGPESGGSLTPAVSWSHVPLAQRAAQSLALQPGDAARIANAAPMQLQQAELGRRHFSGEMIVRARPGVLRSASDRLAPITLMKSEFVDEYVVRVPEGMSEADLAGVLMATGDYEFVMPNWTVFPLATVPNDPQFGDSWQHIRLRSTQAWDINSGSSDVIVAICDTGILLNHQDLAASLVSGYNSANRVTQANGGQVNDINGHGTFCAGLAGAIGNNGVGVTGVGWNFRLMPIRVTNSSGGGASFFALTDGARWAANNGAKVINVSYSGADSVSNSTARDIKNAGGLLFWASGNDNAFFGGVVPDMVIVGSTTSSDTRSSFSNFGPGLGVTAPGSSVRSTRSTGGYGNGSGTSYASPIAAGVGGLIFSTNPALSPDDVQDVLYRSSDDLGTPGFDNFFGHGRVNSFNAVMMAQTYIPRLRLPVSESFDSLSWQDLFEDVVGVAGAVEDPDAPTGGSALEIVGDGTVQTLPLAGRMVNTNNTLRLSVRTTGAEAGEGLTVRYLDSTNQWRTLFDAPASGADTGYVVHEEPLPSAFLWHGVQVRLDASGSDASDVWLVDSFSIGARTPAGAPFAEPFDTGRVSTMRWNNINGVTTTLQGTNFAMEMPAGSSVETVAIPIVNLASFEQYAYFYVGGDGVGADDTLLVQYFTPVSGWQTLATISGSATTASLAGFEYQLPFGVLAANDFRLRFTANTGGGAFFVDDVNVGTNRLPPANPGCSAADLAAPFGVLNFFDLSAYLALFNAGDPAADLAAPFGTLNFFDLSAYLASFNAGCP